MLTGTVPAIREFLVYGYSDAGQTLHIVGFGANARFSALTFPAGEFEAAFVSALARLRDEPRTALFKSSANDSQVTHVIQVLLGAAGRRNRQPGPDPRAGQGVPRRLPPGRALTCRPAGGGTPGRATSPGTRP